MGLPEHTCISCAYLFQSDKGTVSRNQREQALIDENNRWNNCGINYQRLVCYKGNQNYSEFNTNNMVINIRNGSIKPNPCEDWMIFQDISPQDTELRTSNKLAETSIKFSKILLAVSLVGMVMTFIITMIIWYLD